jgi:hypothetical protein
MARVTRDSLRRALIKDGYLRLPFSAPSAALRGEFFLLTK